MEETANIFSRITTNKLTGIGFTLVTVHLVVRDNRSRFYFVKNNSPKEGKLNYEVIDFDTILLTDYPRDIQGLPTPSVDFFFATDENPTTEYNNFELFIQFVTERPYPNLMALKFQGFNSNKLKQGKENLNVFFEDETDKGIIYFPDIKTKP
ncbi:MAG: hypothetical protein HXX16_20465 [Bacteroidales bacterium]|nr:hypothetical protein [Bacteroidales bacterium]